MYSLSRIRGLEKRDELHSKDLIRDTRPVWTKTLHFLKGSTSFTLFMVMFAIISIFMPGWTYFCLLGSGCLWGVRYGFYRKDRLPLRLPAEANRKDYSDPYPGRRKFALSKGVFFLGNERETNQECWLTAKDVLTHMLIFGTTGSGKTETLVSLAFNTIAMGSGLVYVDPKGAVRLAAQVYIMARFCGRDDDFRLMNYIVQAKPPKAEHPKKISNTTNPFAFGSAESLTQLLVSLIPKSEGDNAIFGQNAQTLITSAMYALVELRNSGELELSIETIRDHLVLHKFDAWARRTDLSESTVAAIKSFLSSVGWQEHLPFEKQPRPLAEQFGYARSYFGLPLASLSDTYGHIYKTSLGEVCMFDVIRSRRILVVILPSLEKAPQELENLGKITLSAVRNAISIGLGDKVEGEVSDVLESLPTESKTPMLVITDEYAAITTPGYSEVFTQGRSQGIGAIVATQDYPGLKKADEIGADQIIANTKTKIFKKVMDDETYQLINKLAGEADVMQTDGFHINKESTVPLHYEDQMMAKHTKMSIIHPRDLQQQIMGEFHCLFEGEVTRGRVFYANPPLKSKMQIRINQMVPVPLPSEDDLNMQFERREKLYKRFKEALLSEKKDLTLHRMPADIKHLFEVFDGEHSLSASDIAIVAFKNWVSRVGDVISISGRKLRQDRTLKINQKQNPAERIIREDLPSSEKPSVKATPVREKPLKKEPVKAMDPDTELLLPGAMVKEAVPAEDQKQPTPVAQKEETVSGSIVDATVAAVRQETEYLFASTEFKEIFSGTDDSMASFGEDMAVSACLLGQDDPKKAAQAGIDACKQAQEALSLEDYPEEPKPSESGQGMVKSQKSAIGSAQEMLSLLQGKSRT